VTGIPLPLISYGGTAAIVFSIAAGAALSVSRRRGS
jgi:cell division protein FtsW (lipid II flippase)